MAEPTRIELIEKIVRAQVSLENSKARHGDNCVVNLDPDSMAPCNCGASKINSTIEATLRQLKLEG